MSQLTPEQERERELAWTDEELRGYEPIHPQSRWREIAKKIWAPIAAVGFLLFKLKAFALVIFKIKIFVTSASMLV